MRGGKKKWGGGIFVLLLVALLSVFRGAKNRAPYWLFVKFLRGYYPASLKDAF